MTSADSRPTFATAFHGAPADILETVEAHHRRLLVLCDDLEAIADSLPEAVDPGECLRMARVLVPTLEAAYGFEEETFFPALTERVGEDAEIGASIPRLCAEHRQDRDAGADIAEALLDWAQGTPRPDANTTGYMLRAFFDAVRRHVAFERTCLVAAYRARIGPTSPEDGES